MKAFVAMPFSSSFDTLFSLINNVCQDLDVEVTRIDKICTPGLILQQIVDNIVNCHFIIVVGTGSNPNVFYELGYAHALRKPAIILVEKSQIGLLPFNIRGHRAVCYSESDIFPLRDELVKAIQYFFSILSPSMQNIAAKNARMKKSDINDPEYIESLFPQEKNVKNLLGNYIDFLIKSHKDLVNPQMISYRKIEQGTIIELQDEFKVKIKCLVDINGIITRVERIDNNRGGI